MDNEARGPSVDELTLIEKHFQKGRLFPWEYDIPTKCIFSIALGPEAGKCFHLLIEVKNISDTPAHIYKAIAPQDFSLHWVTVNGTKPDRLRREVIPALYRETIEIFPGDSHTYELKAELNRDDGTEWQIEWPRYLPLIEPGETYKIQLTTNYGHFSNVIRWTVPSTSFAQSNG